MLVEVDSKRVLLDTGSGKCLVPNAKALDIELARLDAVVLSHGHYDHTGGLQSLLQAAGSAKIYAHPDAFLPKYSCRAGSSPRHTGIAWGKDQIGHMGGHLCLDARSVRLTDHLLTTGEIPRTCEFENTENDFRVRIGDEFEQDALLDDQSLVIEGNDGVVVVTGCAHSGIINTLSWAHELTGKPVKGFIGGTHLIDAGMDRLYLTIDTLSKLGLEFVAPCHCTGFGAMAMMYIMFGDRYKDNSTPNVLEFEI